LFNIQSPEDKYDRIPKPYCSTPNQWDCTQQRRRTYTLQSNGWEKFRGDNVHSDWWEWEL